MIDIAVIGGGPAGCTAALYAVRSGYSVTMFEALGPGGQMANTMLIENYPGFENGINGYDLGAIMTAQAERFGVKTINEKVTAVELDGKVKKLTTSSGTYEARAVIIATGAFPRKLGIKDEDEMRGHGVAYCATCDGMMFKNKPVAVIGGGNSAIADAMYLSKICPKVYIVHRRDSLRASRVYIGALKNVPNIEYVWNSKVTKILHDRKVTGIEIEDVNTGKKKDLQCDAIFVSVGRDPMTEIFKGKIDIDDHGYIVADESTVTSVPGVFAAGDVRTKEVRQVVAATADGAFASKAADDYLSKTN